MCLYSDDVTIGSWKEELAQQLQPAPQEQKKNENANARTESAVGDKRQRVLAQQVQSAAQD